MKFQGHIVTGPEVEKFFCEIVPLTLGETSGPVELTTELTDMEEIGARIALKARLRMVPIHTVGVGSHPFDMMIPISEESDGTYFDLSK